MVTGADTYRPLIDQVARLETALTTLRNHHNTLREQNEGVIRTGLSMESVLKPVENGLRLEAERQAAEEAASRTAFDGRGEEGKGDEPVGVVGRRQG